MNKAKAWKVILPVLPALLILTFFCINASLSYSTAPQVKGGVLDLSDWDMEKVGAFHLDGEWEFYWGELLGEDEIERKQQNAVLVEAPVEWNAYKVDGKSLPGWGMATYRARVINAPVGEHMAVRIQNQASAYRLYIDGKLLAENGRLGDGASAPVSDYRPQFTDFVCEKENFNIILQVTNDAYAVGGMWEPVMFGLYESMAGVNNMVKFVGYFSLGSIVVMGIFFLIMFTVSRRERELLILSGIGAAVLLRLLIHGEMTITYLFPNMPIAGFAWIDYLTLIWTQFFLLYFVYWAYTSLISIWQIRILLGYALGVSIFIILFPVELVTSTYMIMNIILLLVVALVVAHLTRATIKGGNGASLLLAAMSLILVLIFYEMFVSDMSITYFLLQAGAADYTILFFVQCAIVARRYNEAQRLEMELLKAQIHPHFIHNALATIISISRRDVERSRELLMDFSSYLRGCYDYQESDELIPLEQELEFVGAYAALEQARFGEKLQVEYRIEAANIMLPPLILQPLVENAFIHGLRGKAEGGTVIVYALMKGSKVRIGVRDNGVGIKAGQADPSGRRGIGIENINRRLSRFYHTQLTFIVPPGGGCEVYMEIPYKEARHEDNAS